MRPARGLTKKVRGTNLRAHHETRILGRPRRQLLGPGPRSRRWTRTKDRKDFRNGRQPVHAAEHTALRAATLRPHPRQRLPAGLPGRHARAAHGGGPHRSQPATRRLRQHHRRSGARRAAAAARRRGLRTAQCLQHQPADAGDRHRDGSEAHRAAGRDSSRSGLVGARRRAVRKARRPAPRPGVLAAAHALSHRVRARRRAPDGSRADASARAQHRDLLPHDALQAQRAQGHRRWRGGGRGPQGSRRPVGGADRRRDASGGGTRAHRQVAHHAAEHHQPAAAGAAHEPRAARAHLQGVDRQGIGWGDRQHRGDRAVGQAARRACRAAGLCEPRRLSARGRVGQQPGRGARHDQPGGPGGADARARGSRRHPEADRHAGAGERHALIHPAALGLVVLCAAGAQGTLRFRSGARRAVLRARSRAAGRCVLRRAPALRPELQGAPGPARLPAGRARVRGIRRRRRAARAVPRRLFRARQQAGRGVDGRLRDAVAAAASQAGGGESPEHPQAAGRPAGAAHLR